jgi:uncharacterized membrane protein
MPPEATEAPTEQVAIGETADAIAELHAAHQRQASPAERRLQRFAARVSTPIFLLLVTLLTAAWIAANVLAPRFGLTPFDPAPYSLLQGILAMVTVYITLAILIVQRRANALAELRAQVTLEHCILAEHKAAKVIELVEELRRDHPAIADRIDHEAKAMAQPTDPRAVAAAITDSHDEKAS